MAKDKKVLKALKLLLNQLNVLLILEFYASVTTNN